MLRDIYHIFKNYNSIFEKFMPLKNNPVLHHYGKSNVI